MKIYSLLLILLAALVSCTKESSTCSCGTIQIEPSFPGYTAAEIDTIYERIFEPGSNFSKLFRATVWVHPKTIANTGTVGPDSLVNTFDPTFNFNAGFDYELFIPNLNHTIRIYNIIDTGAFVSCHQFDRCNYHRSISYMVSGATDTTYNGFYKESHDSISYILMAFGK